MQNSGEARDRIGVHRLTPDDDLFVRMERVLGAPVVNQIVWLFDTRVDIESVRDLQAGLAAGALNRRFLRSPVPAARARWLPADQVAPVAHTDAAVPICGVSAWIEKEASVPLNAETGPAWRLAATDVEGAGSAVSLTSSHVIADGGAMVRAVVAALEHRSRPVDASEPGSMSRMISDLVDSSGQLWAAASGLVKAVRMRYLSSVSPPRDSPPRDSPPGSRGQRPKPLQDAGGAFVPPTVLVDFGSSEWNDVARRHGGSANTLLVAVLLGVLRASGRVSNGESVRVSLPVSLRRDNDPRANATSGVSIVVDGGDAARRDLSPVRDRMKSAFIAASDPSVLGYLAPLRQMLPDRAIRALAGTPSAPICLCSNLGSASQEFKTLGVHVARSVAMRSIVQGLDRETLRRSGSGISGWLNNSGDVVTLCVTGLDPDSFPEQRVLSGLVSAECRRWKLTPEIW